jgi:DNA-binding transcriptional ArsR family regulator
MSIDETLVRAVAHPLRVRVLSILNERSASPKELGAELDTPIANVSYHVHELEKMQLIELIDERRRGGAVEHFYRATPLPLMSGAAWERLSLDERHEASASIIQMLLADASHSLAAGLFDAPDDRHLTRVPMTVDEEGWRRLVEIQDAALEAILEVQSESAERLRQAKADDSFQAVAGLTCFELPAKRCST